MGAAVALILADGKVTLPRQSWRVGFPAAKTIRLLHPPGWGYEDSLSAKYKFVKTHDISEFLDRVGHEGGLDTYQDIETGKEVYIGIAGPRQEVPAFARRS